MAETSEPIQISGPRADVVMVSADDWRVIQETLFLLSIPGMRESLVEGMATATEEFEDDPGW